MEGERLMTDRGRSFSVVWDKWDHMLDFKLEELGLEG